MGSKEQKIKNTELKNLDPESERLFRINAGMFWAGKVINRTADGRVTLENARVIHGAPEGFPDLIGWKSVQITQDMVGQTVAVFWGKELKSGKTILTEIQRKFGDMLTRMGGLFEVVRK